MGLLFKAGRHRGAQGKESTRGQHGLSAVSGATTRGRRTTLTSGASLAVTARGKMWAAARFWPARLLPGWASQWWRGGNGPRGKKKAGRGVRPAPRREGRENSAWAWPLGQLGQKPGMERKFHYLLSQVFFKCILKSIRNNLKFSFKPHNTKEILCNSMYAQPCCYLMMNFNFNKNYYFP